MAQLICFQGIGLGIWMDRQTYICMASHMTKFFRSMGYQISLGTGLPSFAEDAQKPCYNYSKLKRSTCQIHRNKDSLEGTKIAIVFPLKEASLSDKVEYFDDAYHVCSTLQHYLETVFVFAARWQYSKLVSFLLKSIFFI